jgi:ribosomal protein S18 acetylase RimI-like enzyme
MLGVEDVSIRLADEDDTVTLAELASACFYQTFASQNTPENMALYLQSNFNLPQVEAELKDPLNTHFLASRKQDAYAYAKLSRSGAPEALSGEKCIELARLYVLEEFQGEGLGAAMLHACEQYAMNEGYEAMWLGVWEHNPKAIAFYQHLGYREFGEHVFMLGNDRQNDLLMKKKLR